MYFSFENLSWGLNWGMGNFGDSGARVNIEHCTQQVHSEEWTIGIHDH